MRRIKNMFDKEVEQIISDIQLDEYIERVHENDTEYADMITVIQQQFNMPPNRSMIDCQTFRAIEHYIGRFGLADEEKSYKYPTNFDKTSIEYAEFCNTMMSKKRQLEKIIDTFCGIPNVVHICGQYMDIIKNVHNNCRILKINAVMIHAELCDWTNSSIGYIKSGYTFCELIDMLIELKNDKYGDDELFKLILLRYKDISDIWGIQGPVGRVHYEKLAIGTYEDHPKKRPHMHCTHVIKSRNLVEQHIISEIKEIIGKIQLSYENTMSLIYAILYDYTKKGLFQHRYVYPTITMNKSMYINSVHIRTTNPYYKKIYMYKNILADAKYDDKVEEHSVDFATYIQKGNTLDVYFIQMIKKRYPDDVISVDHIIDNHLNITSPSIHMNDTTNDCMNHPFSSTMSNEHKSII